MKNEILLELANVWDIESSEPEILDGSEEAQLSNAVARGRREGLREAADALRMLVELLG